MLEFQLIEVGSGGRASCARCGASPEAATYLPTEEVIDCIRRAVLEYRPPGPNIRFGGADAFGHPELPVLVSAAVQEGVVRIGLETDGSALAAGDNAAGALHAGVRHIHVSHVDAAGALAGIAAWTQAVRAAGVDAVATATVPVCVHNVAELAKAVAAMAEAGVAGITVDARSVSVSAEVTAYVVAACDTGTVNSVWVEVLGPSDMLPESHSLHRGETGDSR